MDKVVSEQIGCNVKVYMDYMVVKNYKDKNHYDDLEYILNSIIKYNMNHNKNKCLFRVNSF